MATEHYAWPTITDNDLIDVVAHLDTALDKADETVYGVDKKVEKNASDIAELDKRVTDTENDVTDLTGRVTANEADILAGKEKHLVELEGSFDESSRTLSVSGKNEAGEVKTNFTAVIPEGGGGTEVNSIAPTIVEKAPKAYDPDNPNYPNIAIGPSSGAGEPEGITSGNVTVGCNAYSMGGGSTAMGANSGANGTYSAALGGNAGAIGDETTAVGARSYVKSAPKCTAIGNASACYSEDVLPTDANGVVSFGGSKTNDSAHVAHTKRLINVSQPVNGNDAATKAYIKKVVTALCEANNLTPPSFD